MIRSNRQKKRILFVEDHDDAWEIVEFALEEFKLAFACTFDDGLRSARQGYFDLYINEVKLANRRPRVLAGKSSAEACPRGRGGADWLAIFPNLTSLTFTSWTTGCLTVPESGCVAPFASSREMKIVMAASPTLSVERVYVSRPVTPTGS